MGAATGTSFREARILRISQSSYVRVELSNVQKRAMSRTLNSLIGVEGSYVPEGVMFVVWVISWQS